MDLWPLVRAVIQQHQQQQAQRQQQQQPTQAAPRGSARPIVHALGCALMVLHLWQLVMKAAPELLPTVLSALVPLVQQLQSCS
jgi:hypothetical protein